MAEQPPDLPVYIDSLPEQARIPEEIESFRETLRLGLERELDGIICRYAEVPSIIVHDSGEYLHLLIEARDLYFRGFFYSCVAMCGIVAERIVKDTLRSALHVQRGQDMHAPTDEAFDQLERVEISGLIRFIGTCGIVSTEVQKAAEKLGQLRNDYAHARGRKPKSDALKAIKLLHQIVEGTVSVFKDFKIYEGKLVPRDNEIPPPSA